MQFIIALVYLCAPLVLSVCEYAQFARIIFSEPVTEITLHLSSTEALMGILLTNLIAQLQSNFLRYCIFQGFLPFQLSRVLFHFYLFCYGAVTMFDAPLKTSVKQPKRGRGRKFFRLKSINHSLSNGLSGATTSNQFCCPCLFFVCRAVLV